MKISVIIRAYNEEKYLGQLLEGIARQELPDDEVEVILVDSGSTDGTVGIATRYGARIVPIRKEDFTFGRSLNVGCEAATGDALVLVSAHCIPTDNNWLRTLVQPLRDGVSPYAYGRQVGWGSSKFSECQLFRKYYPDASKLQRQDFFCNNANAVLLKSVWEKFRFDEELTGLEDMDLGRRLIAHGYAIAYVADSGVHHIHEEVWSRVKTRYEREAIALQLIMPQVHVGFTDFLRYFFSAVFFDFGAAIQERRFRATCVEICLFRFFQFWGTYKGNQQHRLLSRQMKENYFYPK